MEEDVLDGTAMPIAYAKGRIDMTVTSASLSICRSLDDLTPAACDALAEYARTVEFRRGERWRASAISDPEAPRHVRPAPEGWHEQLAILRVHRSEVGMERRAGPPG